MTETIEQLSAERVDWLETQFTTLAWPRPIGYFSHCFAAQQRGERQLLISRSDERLNGYLHILWRPDYPPFRDAGIPEIHDLNVVPCARRQGVATRLMDHAEHLVAERYPVIGIGVGLHPGYGPAQRMYVVRGYLPDALPLTYGNAFVTEGQTVKLDDELVLHLTKDLHSY